MADLKQEEADAVAKILEDAGFDVSATVADLSSLESILKLIEHAQSFGTIRHLIVAEMIAEATGAELFGVRPAKPYPKNYKETTDVAQKEQRGKARPKMKENVKDIAQCDVIFLGYPNWWADMPMIVYTFLDARDFSDKTVIPFCTHEGSGLSGTEGTLKRALPGATEIEGLAVRGIIAQRSRAEARRSVTSWLQGLGSEVIRTLSSSPEGLPFGPFLARRGEARQGNSGLLRRQQIADVLPTA
ncbi:MAG: NAD(P)H-dependent oxidoreductase, partial [Synergistaceae bacterium]|nr:NAD(P)H-dependent oxidoreductase [Synergistaceae bacterium]